MNDEQKQLAYNHTALRSGNQALVNNDTIQWWIPDFRSAGIMEYEYTYMDLDEKLGMRRLLL